MGDAKIVINGLDYIALIETLETIKNRFVKITLTGVEDVCNQDLTEKEKFKQVRKYILDGFNDELRTMLRSIFNDDSIQRPR